MPRKLGRKPRSFNPNVAHMRTLRGAAQAPIPAALSWLHGMPDNLGMMLNGPDPVDPNALQLGDCVPQGVIVAGGATDQVYRGQYSGPIIVLSTRSGKKLPVTPNHAVLTKRGFVRACDLQKGDDLIGTSRPDVFPGASFLGGETNVNNAPSHVEQIFSSFVFGRRLIREVVPHAVDFHGDQKFINGNVDIVGADSFLRRYSDAALYKPNAQDKVGSAGKLQRVLERLRSAFLTSSRRWSAAFSSVGLQSPEFALGLAHYGIAEKGRLAQVSRNMSGAFNRHFEPSSINSGFFAERKEGFTGNVSAHQFGKVAITQPRSISVADALSSYIHASSAQPSRHGGPTDPKLSGRLFNAVPELVEADQLVNIDFQTFEGHVYDLSTEAKFYSANGLLVHNCTCAALAHARQVWTFNATGTMVTLANQYVLALYEQACGYVLNDPSTDQGGNEQQLLIYCQTTGIPTPTGPDRIMGFVELELTVADIKRAIAEGGVVYLGIQIPEDWCSAPVGSTWDVSPSAIGGGHAIIGAAYDADYIYVVSWGLTWPMTWAAFRQYCDEAYVIFSHTWLRATGRTPFNVPMADFESAMNALGQEGPSDVKPA